MAEPRREFSSYREMSDQDIYHMVAKLRDEFQEKLREQLQEIRKTIEEQRKADHMSVQQEGRLQSVEMILTKQERLFDIVRPYDAKIHYLELLTSKLDRYLEGADGMPGIRHDWVMFRAWHAYGRKVAMFVLLGLLMGFFGIVWDTRNYKEEARNYKQETFLLQQRLEKLEQQRDLTTPR